MDVDFEYLQITKIVYYVYLGVKFGPHSISSRIKYRSKPLLKITRSNNARRLGLFASVSLSTDSVNEN